LLIQVLRDNASILNKLTIKILAFCRMPIGDEVDVQPTNDVLDYFN